MSTGEQGKVRVNHGRWARLMAGIITGIGMLTTLPAQAAPIPPVYEIQIIPYDDLVILRQQNSPSDASCIPGCVVTTLPGRQDISAC